MNALTVRRLTEQDSEAFRRVRLEALRLHPEAFGASYEAWCQRPTSFFAEKLRSDRVFGGFDSENTLQGIIGLRCETAPKLCHIATIWGMYVRADLRGSGLAALLMAAALEAAGPVRTVKLAVVTTNQAACALYRAFGFITWATDTAALCVDGVFHDEFLMKREPHSR